MNNGNEVLQAPQRPRRFSERELAKAYVEIVPSSGILLQCKLCSEVWSPNIQRGGKLPRGYWKCPRHCNV